MKRAALHMGVSTLDQHPETQLHDLRKMAVQRDYQIVHEYTDRMSVAKARRPGPDAMMSDGRHGGFDVVLVWASDRIARSVKHFLEVLDELNRLNIEHISFRENIDTGAPDLQGAPDQQRKVINDIHKRIITVTKWGPKTRFANPTK